MKKLLLFIFICWFNNPLQAQNTFMIGSSSKSIEPGTSVVSAALAGYGVPREGRFSITWDKVSQLQQLKNITAYKDGFLAINTKEELLYGKFEKQSVLWKTLGKANGVSAIAVSDDKIYAVNNGQLLNVQLKKNRISWKKINQPRILNSLTSFNDKLYASGGGQLLEGKIAKSTVQWKSMGGEKKVISLTSDDKMLYALNSGDTIWSVKPYMDKKAWTVIGRNNGITFKENLINIAVINNVLYAVNKEQQLLRGSHKSNNDLIVSTLAIKSDNQTVVIAGLDVCGFDGSFVNSIKDHFYKKYKLPASAILINASHTHFAPVTQAWPTWGEFNHVPDTNYLNNVVKKNVIASIEEALDNLAPADMFFGRGTTAIGANRRNTKTITRPYDNTLDVVKILDKNKQIKSLLFSAGCHPVFQNKGAESFTLGANYPAIARQHISSHANHSVFLQGCAGDINPQESNYHLTGNALGKDVVQILRSPMQEIGSNISFYMDTVKIPVKPWSIAQIKEFKEQNITKIGDIEAEKNVRWADLMLERYRNNEVSHHMPVYVQTINIGQWKLVGLSREVVTEYGLSIRDLWPDKLVTVAGYCNDVSSYLPADWHIETGVYEGYGSFFWYGQSGLPPLDILRRVVSSIKENNR